jgi:predicted DNA binding CopG/RHH family protein
MMKDYDLDTDEKEIVEAFEAGEFISVPNQKREKVNAQAAAKVTLNKTRNITIRLSERDLYKLKARAIEEGIPYQTLASSPLRKATAR